MNRERLHLALDLGTTTLAGRLLDAGGRTLAEAKIPNPQRALGSDVIRRLEAALGGAGAQLQSLLAEGINGLCQQLLSQVGQPRSAITAAAAAGNPAICHLLRQLPVEGILFPPHRPKELTGVALDPAALGLELPVPLYLFPLVSGYVGGDLVAFLYGLGDVEPGTFCLDVGTNGEMGLFTGQGWWVTSVAAGPAFEAGEISCGMALQPGAIEQVQLLGDRLQLRVHGGGPPRGLCGSGLASAVAAALQGGLIDRHGTIVDPLAVASNLAACIVETKAGRALRLYRDATVDLQLTQEDIRQFQLAKGAVKAGVESLLQRCGLNAGAVGRVLVTGALGFSLPDWVVKKVVMLPEAMVEKVEFIAAGALQGVCRLLAAANGPAEVATFAATLRPLPLSGTPTFEAAFLQAIEF
ncbi:MAG: ASKHA domain-containing protein [Trichloromonadaceae bacterium]